ncbi:polysaccharide biosynthesis tyrosine autokinase [Caminibacter mediatlanticus TB-2]|uniref:non-specific protein-tyrosine kinase n=1 Tax=Caminibacter mediatlanticus TB-2 TaxID=391592 RepID=A0ABX5VAT7_9BACT|nr:polysaccharide biosynthesis tyrosine autokinase [Caminibacter mediatlanticus]QCT93969.1 polysaccharide biosynthesis tyrosine autokinase [Caminibacter mediatlanticus TB-2]
MNEINRNDVLDIKEVFQIIKRNIVWILFFILLSVGAALVYLYFATPMYKTYGTVEVSTGNSQSAGNDILAQALNLDVMGPNAINTEMQILKSRRMIERVLNHINFTRRYFIIKNFKTKEVLEKSSPIIIKVFNGENIVLTIKPLNQRQFKLLKYNNIDIDKIFEFNNTIKLNNIKFEIIKKSPLDLDSKYKILNLNKVKVADALKNKVNVSLLAQKSSILKVEYSDNIPSRAANFINTLLNVYIQESIQNKTKQANQTLEFIDKQLKIISKKLAESELALENYKKTHKIVDLTTEAQNILMKLNDLETQYNSLKLKENLIKFIEDKIKNGSDISIISANILDDKVLSELISQLQQLILKKQNLLLEYTEKYPEVVSVNNQIKTINQMILNRIQNLKSVIESNKKTLENMILNYENMLSNMPQNERKLIDLQRVYQVNEKIYSYLLEKRAATALAKSSIISNNRIIDSALIPNSPYKPKKIRLIIIAIIVGLFIGLAFIYIKELFNDKIRSIEDIEKETDAPIVGTVPHFKKTNIILKVFESPKSSIAEAFRTIRTNIRFLSKDARLITVTSTVPNEGKTTLSSNLASIYSLAKKKTVVVNLDMRKPTLHTVFNVPNDVGVSNILSGEVEVDKAIKKTKFSNLDVITSGPIPPNPGELIQNEEMDKMINYLKNNYDIIIFDTPPVGLVVDAISVLTKADVNLYIFRANYSKKEFIKTLNDLKNNKKIPGLGIVLNDVKDKSVYGYGYGYGYGYYTDKK